ncbi:hypothetical protein [Caminibacter pacificus]|uniref:Uncharacterized protein n=1 Tax=Caminibacter pacificus TaxID=1424653 RepID=A0AAJ4UWZ7_9BACT|nr:hypothetical protein [Caminibacter pacificus]QDD68139.1 hypothetical protein C6V80_09810 [Caminibacter pacificus]ROR38757.1 hypothetical protein EDC58_1972 [Caminibacter pacificus]
MFKKLSKNESTSILLSLRASMGLGFPFQKAIQLQAESQERKTGRILKMCAYLILKKEQPIADVLYKFGIINAMEKTLLEHSKSPKETIENIIQMREMSGLFFKNFLAIILKPLLAVIVGMGLVLFIFPKVNLPVQALMEQAKMNGINVKLNTGFWYIDNFQIVSKVLIIYLIFLIVFLGILFYIRKYKPSILFKIFPLSAYDDIPAILLFLKSLHSLGLPSHKIAEILEKSNVNPGWRPLFKKLKTALIDSKPIWKEFFRFGFPKESVNFIKYTEEGKIFWENIDKMIKYAKQRAEDGNKMMMKIWNPVSYYLAYIVIVYFLVGLIMLTIEMQNIATQLQSQM